MTDTGTPAEPLEGDFLSFALLPEYRENPYPFLATLRESDPVFHTPFGVWLLTRHADVAAVVRDPHLSNDERNSDLYARYMAARGTAATILDEALPTAMLFLDPPDHTRIRGLVSQAFTPRVVEGLRPRAQEIVDGLLDTVAARSDGHMDVVADLAYPLPVIVICELLGVPASDHETFAGWSRELAGSIDPAPLRTPEQEQRINEAAMAFVEYFAELVTHRRAAPGDDLLSALIVAEEGGERLTEPELYITAMFLLIAGHETTVNLIGNGTLALLHNPGELERLRADPSLGRNAVDELLRYDSPVQITQRITLDDYEIGGITIPPRSNVVPVLGAANRDPDAFADPDRLDLGRPNARQHVGFGGGAHFCLGAPLARLEAEIAIGTLVRRFPGLELAGAPVRRPTFTLRGLTELPAAL